MAVGSGYLEEDDDSGPAHTAVSDTAPSSGSDSSPAGTSVSGTDEGATGAMEFFVNGCGFEPACPAWSNNCDYDGCASNEVGPSKDLLSRNVRLSGETNRRRNRMVETLDQRRLLLQPETFEEGTFVFFGNGPRGTCDDGEPMQEWFRRERLVDLWSALGMLTADSCDQIPADIAAGLLEADDTGYWNASESFIPSLRLIKDPGHRIAAWQLCDDFLEFRPTAEGPDFAGLDLEAMGLSWVCGWVGSGMAGSDTHVVFVIARANPHR